MTAQRRLRICVADDHEIVRDGLKALIDAQPDLCVVGTAADGAGAVRMVRELQPDVLVMDVAMPGVNGIDATAQLTLDAAPARVVILSVHEDRSYFRRLIAAGARGYVLKRSAMANLIHAIRTVADGGLYVDPALASRVLFDARRAAPPDGGAGTDLTGRELQVLQLVARGLTNREIAEALVISVKTVETYKTRINEKMRFSSRADLVRYALRAGLLTADGEPELQ
jgi:DNA-binding NarL/FixJ family response regulator